MYRINVRRVAVLPMLAAGGLALAAPGAAQDRTETAPAVDHVGSLRTCQALADGPARLACYDRAVATMVAATDAGELRLLDQEAMKDTRRRLFGFSLPRLGLFGGGKGDEEMEILQSTITSVRQTRSDAFTFEIAEGGATWQVTNAPSRLRPPKVGQPVEFKKAAMGSYFIRFDGQIGIKGRRIQ